MTHTEAELIKRLIRLQMPKEIVPILSGGGTRLACYIGILKALQEQGLTFRHLVGVSGGSIVAALYAAGWSLSQMHELAMTTDNTGIISSVNFDMTLTQKQWLYDIGYQTATEIVPVKLAELFT